MWKRLKKEDRWLIVLAMPFILMWAYVIISSLFLI